MRVPIGGSEVFYTAHGQGRPVLLMHGGPGLDHTSFRPWLDPLGERALLIFYDQLGNGRSARPASFDGVTHQTWVQEADALRSHLGHERVVVLGHSYGGYLALEYAVRYPERVAGLVLCSTAARPVPPEAMLAAADELGLRRTAERVLAVLAEGVADDRRYAEVFAEILPGYFRPGNCPSELVGEIVAATRFSAAAVSHAFSRCAPSFDLAAELPSLHTPALILAGRYDWVMPVGDTAEPLASGLPDSRLVVFEESGHHPFIEERDRFLTTVAEWLESLPADRGRKG